MAEERMPRDAHETTAHDRSGLDGKRWIASYHLGTGGYGIVHVWVQLDKNDNIVDRVVIKDAWVSKDSAYKFKPYGGIHKVLRKKGLWMGSNFALTKKTKRQRYWKEAYLQGLLTPAEGEPSSGTVPIRGYNRGKNDSAVADHWRLYMDYYPMDSLDALIANHGTLDEYGHNEFRPIPEPFVWWTFMCLARAIVEMERIARARPKARKEQDETVVMIDLKPSNVLLKASEGPVPGRQFPIYPEPQIADFGSAHLTYPTDPDNTGGYLDHNSTPGFYPSELRQTFDEGPGTEQYKLQGIERPIASYTNVWQVGRVIECLMRGERYPLGYDFEHADKQERESKIIQDPPSYPNEGVAGMRYSGNLKELVYRCQSFDPADRPEPTHLLEQIIAAAPNYLHNMDQWATEEWIQSQPRVPGYMTDEDANAKSLKLQEEMDNGSLTFLRNWKNQRLAWDYAHLEVEVPEKYRLKYRDRRDRFWLGRKFLDEMGWPVVPPNPLYSE